jgi:putative intracellular protease/amidase
VLFVGGQAPMYTYYGDERVHTLAAQCYKEGKITAVLCHATCILLKTKVDGKLLVDGKTWTGFANSEERFADEFVGKAFSRFGLRMRRRSFPEQTSLCPAASKLTRFATEISSRGNNSIQALSWLAW